MQFKIFSAVLILALMVSPAFAATYRLDPDHTRIGFGVKHMVISTVKGELLRFVGSFEINEEGKLLAASVSVDVDSLNTRNKKRDDHLRSPDFFDVKKFPEMTFVSKEISSDGDEYKVIGDLTLRGVTKSVTLEGEMLGQIVDPWGNRRVGFHATGKINRQDFGMKLSELLETGGLVVGNEVVITLDIEGIETK